MARKKENPMFPKVETWDDARINKGGGIVICRKYVHFYTHNIDMETMPRLIEDLEDKADLYKQVLAEWKRTFKSNPTEPCQK